MNFIKRNRNLFYGFLFLFFAWNIAQGNILIFNSVLSEIFVFLLLLFAAGGHFIMQLIENKSK